MVARKTFEESTCPVARALDIVGDSWSLLVIRDAFDGATRFSEFEANTGIAKNILSNRLKKLVDGGILRAETDIDGCAYRQYFLTKRGLDLFNVIVSLRQWGEVHSKPQKKGAKSSQLVERASLKPVAKLQLTSQNGKALSSDDVIVLKA